MIEIQDERPWMGNLEVDAALLGRCHCKSLIVLEAPRELTAEQGLYITISRFGCVRWLLGFNIIIR
jgi:hypothetical protein